MKVCLRVHVSTAATMIRRHTGLHDVATFRVLTTLVEIDTAPAKMSIHVRPGVVCLKLSQDRLLIGKQSLPGQDIVRVGVVLDFLLD